MCFSIYIKVSCKTCGKQYEKRKDSIKEWSGNCIFCAHKIIANTPKMKKFISERSSGKKSNFWRGGVCPINMKIRRSNEYINWRKSVFERDNYTCQNCLKIGGKLVAHHIKTFSLYPKLRFAIDNGQTLCRDCHTKTNTYGINQFSKINWECLTLAR